MLTLKLKNKTLATLNKYKQKKEEVYIMLKFALTKNLFENEDEYNSLRQKVKAKEITVDDIELYIKSDIALFWNDIICYFNFNGRNCIGRSVIFPREMFKNYIESHFRNLEQSYMFLQICKQNGLLGISSRGYTVEQGKIVITDDEHEKLMDLIWNKGI